jgi:hypothetical protein
MLLPLGFKRKGKLYDLIVGEQVTPYFRVRVAFWTLSIVYISIKLRFESCNFIEI